MHTEKFIHKGKTYEVRVIFDGQTVYVRVFQSGKPANPFQYSATLEDIDDMAKFAGTDAVKHLVETAKQDVIKGIK